MFKRPPVLTELPNVPQSMVGAPCPFVSAGEHDLTLFYYIQNNHPDWDGTYVNVVSENSDDEIVAQVSFERPYAHFFGPPNEEAIGGHPLAKYGLSPWAAFEVSNSEWIKELCKRNSIHPYHKDSMFEDYRHFIFTFHDTTFEVLAKGYVAEILGPMSVLSAANKKLEGKLNG